MVVVPLNRFVEHACNKYDMNEMPPPNLHFTDAAKTKKIPLDISARPRRLSHFNEYKGFSIESTNGEIRPFMF